jgi:hypothetical protein
VFGVELSRYGGRRGGAKRGNERRKKWKLRVRKTRFLPLAIIYNALTIRVNEKNM